ncbi:MAG: CapA family protein [Treponemataceae bacterium]|nr:MAG: CapA family protein [Treponemataceae bacterium]
MAGSIFSRPCARPRALSNAIIFAASALTIAAFFSCKTVSLQKPDAPDARRRPIGAQPTVSAPPLVLTLAGDIMAHSVNWQMDDYSLIYKDIENLLLHDDLSFANFETPVYADRPYETYPAFNVQPPYAQAAIDAGFDVFSLANNHTNDQGLNGMEATREFFAGAKAQGRDVYSAGIKSGPGAPLTSALITVNGWTVLFAAVTEILNSPAHAARIDYIAPNKKSRDDFLLQIAEMRAKNPCDIFVLSIHSNEEEYIHTVSDSQKNFYRSLLDAGVDIVWANHVHVARGWEIIGGENEKRLEKIIFYSAGNTISGQRTRLSLSNPANNRDNTGDGFLFSVRIERDAGGWKIAAVTPIIITTYRDELGRYTIKMLNDNFIAWLREKGKNDEADYFAKREEIMRSITGTTIWQLKN